MRGGSRPRSDGGFSYSIDETPFAGREALHNSTEHGAASAVQHAARCMERHSPRK